ncbi:MAG: DUF2721 domain-containing protein [Acidobacteria bacterium]|nr:MAG: DUF2721 domain-containing protein [Acidobacteriota bacterium]REK03999.1 MAG: DUF2721 domain-containing protein [Acidobacteriota bacterium]REK15161.1 MAG: DUF2721 domain-containing protein [Acidobacteriota bacterium]REK46251.1 MAG: DUF2721 domain-containing protein [Acidobacteriota bacterium]
MLVLIIQSFSADGEQSLSSTIAFLTAMITPALLISATGSLVLSTSTRLGRVIDRVRDLDKRLAELITSDEREEIVLYEKRVAAVFDLLDKVTTRSRILQKAQFSFYAGLLMFVLTSLTIGAAGLLNDYAWMPVPVGLVGILCVFYGSILMMAESRMATATVNVEMDITWELANIIAPKDISERYTYNKHGKHRFRTKEADEGED